MFKLGLNMHAKIIMSLLNQVNVYFQNKISGKMVLISKKAVYLVPSKQPFPQTILFTFLVSYWVTLIESQVCAYNWVICFIYQISAKLGDTVILENKCCGAWSVLFLTNDQFYFFQHFEW